MSWSTCYNHDMYVIKRVDLYLEVEKWPRAGLIGIGYVALVNSQ